MERAVTAVLAQVRRSVRARHLLGRGDRVLVAVSGGPDSVGLLAILARLQRRLEIELVAAHVNHRLRGPDAVADERCAADAAARLGVPFVRCELTADLAAGGNLEARARRLRYAALHRLAREAGCTRIATGHTQDDQAETVLLRLVRGATSGGLRGIRPRREDGIIRPLIDCQRVHIEDFVRRLGLGCRTDESNRDPRFARTHVRHRLLPILRELNPSVVQRIGRAAELFGAEADVVAAWAAEQVRRMVPDGRLDVAALATVRGALQGHVVRAWLLQAGVPTHRLTARHVESVIRIARSPRASASVALPGGRSVRRTYGWLQLGGGRRHGSYEPCGLEPGDEVSLPGGWCITAGMVETVAGEVPRPADLWAAVCDADAVGTPLTVRCPRRGERMRPLGLCGTRKLSDIFIDRKVPASERWFHPVVASGEDVLWVPGLARGQGARIGARTRRIFRLQARRNE